jgi:hypothetical protein
MRLNNDKHCIVYSAHTVHKEHNVSNFCHHFYQLLKVKPKPSDYEEINFSAVWSNAIQAISDKPNLT